MSPAVVPKQTASHTRPQAEQWSLCDPTIHCPPGQTSIHGCPLASDMNDQMKDARPHLDRFETSSLSTVPCCFHSQLQKFIHRQKKQRILVCIYRFECLPARLRMGWLIPQNGPKEGVKDLVCNNKLTRTAAQKLFRSLPLCPVVPGDASPGIVSAPVTTPSLCLSFASSNCCRAAISIHKHELLAKHRRSPMLRFASCPTNHHLQHPSLERVAFLLWLLHAPQSSDYPLEAHAASLAHPIPTVPDAPSQILTPPSRRPNPRSFRPAWHPPVSSARPALHVFHSASHVKLDLVYLHHHKARNSFQSLPLD